MFPIKYIDNNLVWNKDNEVFAYYELIPYNYSFLSPEQKYLVHDSFRQLIAQSREGKIHALQIATESSIRSIQEQSKKLVTGKLREVAIQKIDDQTEALVSMIGDNQVDYRFFLGFKLMVTEDEVNLKNIKKSVFLTFREFLNEVRHTLMNDFVSMSNDEINRYVKMEKLLENKISRRFKIRRLEAKDFAYLMEHLYGRDGIAYEDYEYPLPKRKLKRETLIKYYDLIRPTRCVVEESQRYLRLEHEDSESYVSYFTVNAIVGELDFPSSEIFYFQQQQFTFPVDTSMNVEIVGNKKALTTVRNKKKELKDLDNHAYQAGNETSSNVVEALDSVDELETDLDQSKESMYKLSYVIRVSAPDLDELKRRCDEVKDFYDDLNVKLVRPAGDMMGLHGEFLPASKRYINDYIQYVKSDFLAGLGFGATQMLGENTGIYIGYSVDTGRNVYLQPSLASQGVKGTVTNALASAFVGSLGGGKSFCNNLLVYYSVLFGGQAVILDPKSERGNWKETLPEIAEEINIVNITSDSSNQGLLDPYVIMKDVKRPLPSMMMPMERPSANSLGWFIIILLRLRGGGSLPRFRQKVPRTRSSARHLTRFVSPRRSDGHDLLLLFLNGCVDVLDILVGQLLDLFFHGLLGVLGQLTGLLHGLGLVHSIAADIAHSHLGLLAQLGNFLCQLLAALLGGSREVQADGGAVINGGDAHIAGHDGLADGAQQGAVPGGDGQSAGLGNGHGCHLLDGSGGTIIIHADLIQHSGICAACAHSAQFAAQMFDRALHLVFVNLGVAAHCGSLLFLFILGLRCNASAL